MKGSFETTESLQGYLHEPDTITGHLSLPTGGSGGTSDYKQLYNKPKINGVTLDGDISSDDLGIDSDGIYVGSGEMPEGCNVQIDPTGEASGIVEDVLVAGTSVVEDGKAVIPLGGTTSVGLVKGYTYYGISVNSDGALMLINPTDAIIDGRRSFYPLTLSTYDRAVKNHLTDGKAPAYTSEEQQAARERIGAITIADIPVGKTNEVGVVKNGTGLYFTSGGTLNVLVASEQQIADRSKGPILRAQSLDYAVKAAMSDGKGSTWTPEEKASARSRLGCEWRYIGKVETTEDVAIMSIDVDSEGNPLSLRKVWIKVVNYPNASDLTTPIRLTFNNMNESIFHDSKMITGVTSSETGMMCEVMVEKINNRIFPVSIYSSYNKTNIPYTLVPSSTSNSINYRPLLGEIDDNINQIKIYSWQNVIGTGAYMEVWGVDA